MVGVRTQDSVEKALVVVLVVEQTIVRPNHRRSTSDEPAFVTLLVLVIGVQRIWKCTLF